MNDNVRPQPPVSAELDLREFHYMPLHVARLRDSDMAVLATGDEFRAAVLLWAACWHQVPASSLPNDDRLLAKLAGYGRDVKGWAIVKANALHGFIECADGRLYHEVIAETAMESATKKSQQKKRTEAATAARLMEKERDVPRNETRNEQRDDVRNVHQVKGIEKKKDHDGDDARARALPKLISDEAILIAEEVATLCGHDPENLPVRWCGAANQVQQWLASGLEKPLILDVAKSVMAAKRDGPPSTINYFYKPIVQEAARRNQPLPCVTPEASNAPKSPRTTANRSSRGAAQQDAQLAGMAAALRKHPGSRLYDGGGGRPYEAGERDGDPTGVRAIAGPKT